MQKLWSSKSRRSHPVPPEDVDTAIAPPSDESNSENDHSDSDSQEIDAPKMIDVPMFGKYLPESIKTYLPRQINISWDGTSNWLILALGVGGVVVVTAWSLQYLIAPEATPVSSLSCKSKISGEWQTPSGKVSLQEKDNNQVLGKYEYNNFERGKVSGEFTGQQFNNVINFEWQENTAQSSQQGKGIFVFGEGCNEFYGSYGTGNNTNNFGNWQGLRLINKAK
ncbi:hypothetical protein HCU40_12000 [Pseudanabaena biceps]|nr:hypothetical protein [Pseudanabaena biceps]